MEEKEIIGGCLGDGHTEDDWLLTGEMVNALPKVELQDQKIFEYDQSGTPDCTLYSAFGSISDLFNYEFSEKEIEEIVEESFKRGRKRGEGWYVKDAVNLVADYWNEHHRDLGYVVYYNFKITNEDRMDYLTRLNYTVCSGFNGNSAYQKDRKDNGRIDNSSFGEKTYGHAVSWIQRDGKMFIKDNYKGRKENGYYTNIYEVVPTPADMYLDGTYFLNCYVYVKAEDKKAEDIKRLNSMKNKLDRMIADNSAMREETNDKEYKAQLHILNDLHRKKKKDIEIELGKYMK